MPSPQLRNVLTAVKIADEAFPVLSWKATLANQGSMATAEARGALSDLVASGLDVIAASQDIDGAEFDIYAGYDGELKLIFSGIVDECDLDWDDNTFIVRGRDHSASLADGRQTLAGLNYRNQTIGQIVKQIADQFGFKSDITDPGIKAGPLMNGENSFNPQPQNYWNLIQTLAENVGYECYMTPQQVLYFGPEKDQGSVTVNYGAERDSGAENPGWGLRVKYNPRNNSNIVVKALSVNPQSTQTIIASAKATPVHLGRGRKTKTSINSKKAKLRRSANIGSGSKSKAKSVYYIRCSGLSPDQAQKRCQAMADNLAKHQIIVEMNIEGLPSLLLHSKINLVETTIDLYGFAGTDLNVSEITHEFEVPTSPESGGFVTNFRAVAQIEDV